ncbi:cellulose biosynthesis protein BcsF [Kluyvera genomosp. 1]|uniref:cellulose biosynthesis protein BcsF n=1 Tax=Kluyvera genomosp. 1 TaxID=2774053 RepID=UPI000690F9EC|nr:cellulose biosynthesis protein BcsF [Kluyvera genomosp. 1]
MMSISDIIQLVVLCALIFFPLGYIARHHQRRIQNAFRLMFLKPRYVKPVGVLRRDKAVRAKSKND